MYSMTRPAQRSGNSRGILLAGLGLIALGLVAYRFGPDLVRYIKMERM